MGEMHYSRTPRATWEEAILKMRSAGITVISTYIYWIQVEEEEDSFNWENNNNLRDFVDLCKKHGMYVWLRIGPWCHGEIRSGGFPDWLQKKGFGLRKNDPGYLKYVERLYNEIGRQVDGFYYKEGGNIIGVQLENELAYKSNDAYQHMLTLKAMAINAGMDVPYYSAFAQGPPDQQDFLSPIGGYPDSPWNQHTKKFIKSVFFFNPLENDKEIGADLFGQIDTKVNNRYPLLSAELGGGMQVTYHRRIKVEWKDVLGIAYTRLGSGLNGMGYYMFHGGINPIGKHSTLQESRATGYPNDVPVINYDFQSPIGAMENLRPSFYEYKLLHSFLNDFQEILAPMPAFFPEQRVKFAGSADTVRVAVRAKNNSGFIFMSNYQRHVDMKPVEDFQLTLQYGNHTMKIPEKPVRFPGNSMTVWPFNMQIEGSKLIYSTAQLINKIETPAQTLYVFRGAAGAEFVFEEAGISNLKAGKALFTVEKSDGKYRVTVKSPGLDGAIHIRSASGKPYEILVLNNEQALASWKYTRNGHDFLVITDADLLISGDQLVFQKTNDPQVHLSVFPDMGFAAPNEWGVRKSGRQGQFFQYTFQTQPVILKVGYQELKNKVPKYLKYSDTVPEKLKQLSPLPYEGAEKIWNATGGDQTFFRRNFILDKVSGAEIYLAFTPDDEATVYCNGTLLDVFNTNNNVTLLNLTGYVQQGSNVIGLKLKNQNGAGGLLARLFILEKSGVGMLPSDLTWRTNTIEENGWEKADFDDSNWTSAIAVPFSETPVVWQNPQPGPLYGVRFQSSVNTKAYRLSVPAFSVCNTVRDLFLKVDYRGDMLALYKNGKLVYDDFNFGEEALIISLKHFGFSGPDEFTVQLFPVKPYHDVYVEDHVRERFAQGTNSRIEKIEVFPVYKMKIKVESHPNHF